MNRDEIRAHEVCFQAYSLFFFGLEKQTNKKQNLIDGSSLAALPEVPGSIPSTHIAAH